VVPCGSETDRSGQRDITLDVSGELVIVDPATFRFSRFTDGSRLSLLTGL